jgi:oligosaccharide repeat unit polymerase
MIVATAVVLVVLAAVNWLRFRDALYPPVIMAGLWALAVLASISIAAEAQYTFETQTLLLVVTGAIAFSVGSLVATSRLWVAPVHEVVEVQRLPARSVGVLLLAVAVLILPLYVRAGLTMAFGGPTSVWWINLRMAVLEGGYGWMGYGITFANCALFWFLLRWLELRGRSDRYLLALALSVALCYAVLATGRTFLLLLATLIIGPLLVARRVKLHRIVVPGFLAMVVVFGTYSAALRIGIRTDSGLGVMAHDVWNLIALYFVGGLFALDHIVMEPSPMMMGDNTLRFFNAVFARLGFDVNVVGMIQPYITHPVTTNVYTVYQPYYLDFGLAGAAMIPFLLGAFHGVLYRGIVRPQVTAGAMFAYALFLYPLLMQFFQDQYLNLTSTWLQYAVIMGIALRMQRRPEVPPAFDQDETAPEAAVYAR